MLGQKPKTTAGKGFAVYCGSISGDPLPMWRVALSAFSPGLIVLSSTVARLDQEGENFVSRPNPQTQADSPTTPRQSSR